MLAMDVATYSYTDLSQSGTPQQVNRSNSAKIEWIIKVTAGLVFFLSRYFTFTNCLQFHGQVLFWCHHDKR